MYILPHERLLLYSFSTELCYHGGCGDYPPLEFSHSKMIFIDLKNCKEIKSTNEFKIDAKIIIFDNCIIIQAFNIIYFYNMNTLDIINKLNFNYNVYLYKYIPDYIVGISKYEDNNNLLIFKIENNNLINNCYIKTNLIFYENNGFAVPEYNNKILYTLKDKRLLLLCHSKMCALTLNID